MKIEKDAENILNKFSKTLENIPDLEETWYITDNLNLTREDKSHEKHPEKILRNAHIDKEGKLVVKRQFEDRYHIIEVKTPCLITALAELATPRYMTVHGIFDAYREKEVKVWTLEELKDTVDMANIGLKGSPTNVKQSFTKQAKGKGLYYKDLSPEDAVETIVAKLEERHII